MVSMVVGRLLILSLCISLLGACASNKETYISSSVGSSANNSYSPNKSYINMVSNFFSWKMHKLPAEDQLKQEQAVFFALNNSTEGDVVEWVDNHDGSFMLRKYKWECSTQSDAPTTLDQDT